MRCEEDKKAKQNFEATSTGGEPSQALTGLSSSPNVRAGAPLFESGIMPKRFTETEKWKDSWFLDLTPEAKLLFIYLCDVCDTAGFFQRHDRLTTAFLGIPTEKLEDLYKELSKSVVLINGIGWLKNFLRHQKNLPLNPENNAHKGAIQSLVNNSKDFSSYYLDFVGFTKEDLFELLGASQGLVSPIGKGKGKGKGKVLKEGVIGGEKTSTNLKKPTFDEIKQVFKNQDTALSFFDYYEANGWKVGRNPMKDWKAAARNWERRQHEFVSQKGNSILTKGQQQTHASYLKWKERMKNENNATGTLPIGNGNPSIDLP